MGFRIWLGSVRDNAEDVILYSLVATFGSSTAEAFRLPAQVRSYSVDLAYGLGLSTLSTLQNG